MKLTTSILGLTLMASAALAQSGIAPINAARRAASASNANTARTNTELNAKPQANAQSAQPTAKTPFAPKTPVKPAAAAAAPAANAAKPATAPATATTTPAPEMVKKVPANARDPFVSIIRTDKGGGVPCVGGKKCLAIGDVILKGIVRSHNTVVAVVENPEKKTYFLHENDPVFEGEVVKITSDSVVFREQVIDRVGKKSTREITKRLNPRPIA